MSVSLQQFCPLTADVESYADSFTKAGQLCVEYLDLGPKNEVEKYLYFATMLSAWKLGESDSTADNFPVDDLDAMKFSTMDLIYIMYASKEEKLFSLLIAYYSREHLLEIFQYLPRHEQACSIPFRYFSVSLLIYLLMHPTKSSVIALLLMGGDMSENSSLSTQDQDESRKILFSWMAHFLRRHCDVKKISAEAISLSLQSMGVSSSNAEPISNMIERAFEMKETTETSDTSTMDIDEVGKEHYALPNYYSMLKSCVVLKLHENRLFFEATQNLICERAISGLGGFEKWFQFFLDFLPPLFNKDEKQSKSTSWFIEDKIRIVELLTTLSLGDILERKKILELLKTIVLEDCNGAFTHELVTQSYEGRIMHKLDKCGSIEEHGATSVFNSITLDFDEDVLHEMSWLSIINPEALLDRFISEMCSQKDTAPRLIPYLKKLVLPFLSVCDEANTSSPLVIHSLSKFVNSVDLESPSFNAICGHTAEAIRQIKKLEPLKIENGLPPRNNIPCELLEISNRVCAPKIRDILGGTSKTKKTKSAILPIDQQSWKQLWWYLNIVQLDISELKGLDSSSYATAIEIAKLVMECDTRLQTSPRVSPLLTSILSLTESILEIVALFGLSESILDDFKEKKSDRFSSSPKSHPPATFPYSWRTLIRVSANSRYALINDTSKETHSNLQFLRFLPSTIFDFFTGKTNRLHIDPKTIMDLIYSSSLGGEVGRLLKEKLSNLSNASATSSIASNSSSKNSNDDPSSISSSSKEIYLHPSCDTDLFGLSKKNFTIALSFAIPRMSTASFNACFENLISIVSNWTENKMVSIEGEQQPERFLRSFSLCCDVVSALVNDTNGIADVSLGGRVENPSDSGCYVAMEIWDEQIKRLLELAAQRLGLGANRASNPPNAMLMLSVLVLIANRLWLPALKHLERSTRQDLPPWDVTFRRLGVFVTMASAEAFKLVEDSSEYHKTEILKAQKRLERACREIEMGSRTCDVDPFLQAPTAPR